MGSRTRQLRKQVAARPCVEPTVTSTVLARHPARGQVFVEGKPVDVTEVPLAVDRPGHQVTFVQPGPPSIVFQAREVAPQRRLAPMQLIALMALLGTGTERR